MNLRIVTYVLAGVFVAGVAAAQDRPEKKTGKQDMAAMQALMDKAGTPGEQHQMLKKWVGKWNVSAKSWMDPKQPPTESTGTVEAKPILGDRFVQMIFSGTVMGKPFNGVSTVGYDNVKKRFVGTWIDSNSTGIMRSEGTADANGNMTSEGTFTDPMTGKDAKMRVVATWQGDDKVTEEFFERRGGKEQKTMELTYTRAR